MTKHSQSVYGIISRLIQRLTKIDYWIIIILIVVALVAGLVLKYNVWLANTQDQPVVGGKYTEGVIASSLGDLEPVLNKLTKVGLVKFNQQGQMVPSLATSWEISNDGKVYTFTLNKNIDFEQIKKSLEENKSLFTGMDYKLQDDQLIFTLEQAFAPFLSNLTNPIFPFGPFVVAKQEKGIVRLIPNPDAITDRPYLEELVLKVYADSFNLTRALAAGEIEGVADIQAVENNLLLNKLNTYTFTLPRKIFLFFNLNKKTLTKDIRQKIRDNKKVGSPIELTLVTLASIHHEKLAYQIKERLSNLNINVFIDLRNISELTQEVIPKRAYDLLIFGLDFGPDPDPYPFWHSSQIGSKGLNLSNFANIDADRLLEEARLTNDPQKRSELYKKFNAIFEQEVPAIELEKVNWSFGVSKNISGITVMKQGISPADRYQNVEKWYKKTRRVTK